MKNFRHQILLFTAAVAFISTWSQTLVAWDSPDHYLTYDVSSRNFQPIAISLLDQFMEDAREFRVDGPARLFNPVEKTHRGEEPFPINNPDVHYMGYLVGPSEPVELERPVRISNQFGTFHISSFQPHMLLAPALKALPRDETPIEGEIPTENHYLCYTIPIERVVGEGILRDQFQVRTFDHLVGVRFCNPAIKIHNETPFEIINAEDHLMCFELQDQKIREKAVVKDQFGERRVKTTRDDELCVPSRKEEYCRQIDVVEDQPICGGYCNDGESCDDVEGACVCITDPTTRTIKTAF